MEPPETSASFDPSQVKIEMRVEQPGGCKVLAAGHKMVYRYPELIKEESDRICANALLALAPVAERMAREASSGREVEPKEVICPMRNCGTVFKLRVMADWETRRSATGITRRFVHQELSLKPDPFLARLDGELVQEIVDACYVERYDKPTVFIREGQEGTALYIVGEGEVEVVRRSQQSDQEVVLAVLGKGECLGEMSLLSGQPATATVRTRGTNTAILVLPKESLEELLDRRRDLHREFSKIIAERLYRMNAALEAEKGHGITGHLSMISIVDLIQSLHASRRTGTLIVKDEAGAEAKVGFRDGEISSAILQDKSGAEALYELLSWTDGEFDFLGGPPELDSVPGARVGGNTMSLLMEGLRRIDEKGKTA